MPDRIVLIDGHALVYRAYHALPPLTSPKGEVVNAVYGFAQMLVKALGDLKPRYLVAAFDTSSQTFRREEYQAYKGTRPPAPDDLPAQFGHVYRLLEALKVPVYRLEGFEADDLLGTLVAQAASQGLEAIILTGDMDALQLVGPHVRVLTSRRGFSDTVLYGEDEVRERYGLDPDQLADLRALRGDSSDNIPGIPGIGDKTAAKLLSQYRRVEDLYASLDKLPEKQRKLLADYAQQVTLAKRLATIVCDLDVKLDLEAAELHPVEDPAVTGLLHELGFRTLVDRLPRVFARAEGPGEGESGNGQLGLFEDQAASAARPARSSSDGPEIVRDPAALQALTEALRQAGGFTLVLEATEREPMRADLIGLALAADAVPSAYLPLAHAAGPNLEMPGEQPVAGLGPLLADAALPKYAHDAKRQMVLLARQGIALRGLQFDTMIAAYLLSSTDRAFDLRDLAWSKLQEQVPPLTDLTGSGRSAVSLSEVPVERLAEYARREADLVCRLVPRLQRELAECELEALFRQVELPLVPVLADLELAGVAVDVPYLQALSRELFERLQQLEQEIYQQVGHPFNIQSTKQLAEVLYEELQLPRSRRTSTGQGSTGADVLESLRNAHPVVELILEHRQLQKLKSTYVDALPLLVNPVTNRVHTSFNQTVAATGRLSSSDPNLQNIPIRTELGRRVRRAFIPGEAGCRLLSADYSQIELRVLAHETQDPKLLEAFREGLDIHAATAAEVMGVTPAEVTPDMRRFAKVVNFGVLYGMSEFGLASRAELPQAEAAGFIQRYFERFGTVKEYQDRIIRGAQQNGYVETLLKRRRYVPDLKSSVYAVRQAAIRAAINHPIQGAASDIMKLAMIAVHQYLQGSGLKSRMILQVHDELVFEAPEAEIPTFAEDLRRIMMGAMKLHVPLTVELKVGPNWEEMGPLEHA